VLRVVPQSDLKILARIGDHGVLSRAIMAMRYTKRCSCRFGGQGRPQDGRRIIAAARTHEMVVHRCGKGCIFTTAKNSDVSRRDPVAQAGGERDSLVRDVRGMENIEAKKRPTFEMDAEQPFRSCLEALSKPASVRRSYMPKSVAETPWTSRSAVTNRFGAIYFQGGRIPTRRTCRLVKNTNMSLEMSRHRAPRRQGSQGRPIGVGHSTDAQTQTNAITNGEVRPDRMGARGPVLALKNNPKIGLPNLVPKGSFALHLNRLGAASQRQDREARCLAVSQEALMARQMVHKKLYNPMRLSIPPALRTIRQDIVLHRKAELERRGRY